MPAKWRASVKHRISNPPQPLLAFDKVRFVGEPLAVIVAESRYIAEDAAKLAVIDVETLPTVVDVEDALKPGAPLVHEEIGDNINGEISTLQSQVATLQSQMSTVQSQISTIQSQITSLQNTDTSLQNQINTINTRLANAGIP